MVGSLYGVASVASGDGSGMLCGSLRKRRWLDPSGALLLLPTYPGMHASPVLWTMGAL
jgi:hypothetical protein